MYVVIRAGGVGSRLWPLSRRAQPKQFHAVLGEQSLIRNSFERALALSGNVQSVFVSCGQQAEGLVREHIPELSEHNCIVEPVGRNTGPAMCLEAAVLETRLSEDAIVCSMPSDDYILEVGDFVEAMQLAEFFVKEKGGAVVAPCAPSVQVDTGFCYAEPGEMLYEDGQGGFFSISGWIEKPHADRCQQLIDSGSSFVHMGMYVYRLGAFLSMWESLHPSLLHVCRLVARDAVGAVEQYNNVAPESVESMLVKRSPHVAMQVLPEVGWSDVGKWHVVRRLLAKESNENVIRGNVLTHKTNNSLLYGQPHKMTAVVGLDNVVVVDTDDGLLVAHGDLSDEIKELVDRMDVQFT